MTPHICWNPAVWDVVLSSVSIASNPKCTQLSSGGTVFKQAQSNQQPSWTRLPALPHHHLQPRQVIFHNSILLQMPACYPKSQFFNRSSCAATSCVTLFFFFFNSSEFVFCKMRMAQVSLSHFPAELGREVGFRSLGYLSCRLGHGRDNQDDYIFPITTSFPQVFRNVTTLEWTPAGVVL